MPVPLNELRIYHFQLITSVIPLIRVFSAPPPPFVLTLVINGFVTVS